ncbi:MAG: hypothetical protein FVQ85_16425 [Planctomycetes bacterium]|nr:hypothetical protein [Planctomycetota bacterium]
MKSLIRTIIVLGVIGLLTVSTTLAQEIPGETASVSNLQPAATAPSPSKEPVPPPPPPSAGFVSPLAGELIIVENAEAMAFAIEPGAYTYVNPIVNLAPATLATAGRSSSRKVLVIPNTEIKTEDLVAITQDLQVMAHIFHKIFTGPRLVEGIFMDYGDFFGRGSRATEAVYLQGYGVLFLMEVNIPLSSPPKAKEQEKDESATKADSVWQQAQQEIFQPSVYRNPRVLNSVEIYDEEKVEELKSRLIKALKHAANMKNLEPDELIILTVIGKGLKSNARISYGVSGSEIYAWPTDSYGRAGFGRHGEDGKSYSSIGWDRYNPTRSLPVISASASTVLTIRAKKSDIDDFAKGDLDYDKFREKVQILTYPSLGQQVVHGLRTRRPGGQDTTTAVPVLPPRVNR